MGGGATVVLTFVHGFVWSARGVDRCLCITSATRVPALCPGAQHSQDRASPSPVTCDKDRPCHIQIASSLSPRVSHIPDPPAPGWSRRVLQDIYLTRYLCQTISFSMRTARSPPAM